MQKLILFIVGLFVATVAFSQSDSTMRFSLKKAQEYALQNNYDLINAKLDIYKAKKMVMETTAIGLPQANVSLSHNYFIDIPVTKVPAKFFDPSAADGEMAELKFGTDHSSKIDFTVSQLIFSGSYIVGLQTAKIYRQLSETAAEQTRTEIMESITNSYYLVLIARANQNILNNNLTTTQKLANETKAMFEQGLVEETAYDQLRVTAMNLKNSVLMIERQKDAAKDLLRIQLGLDLNQNIVLTDSLQQLVDNVNIEGELLKTLSVDSQLDYQLASIQEKLMKKSLDREKTTFLPTISAFYNHQANLQGNNFDLFKSGAEWMPANIVGVTVSLPLFTSGSRLAKISQAKVDYKKAQNTRIVAERSIRMGVVQAQKALLTANEKYINQTENIKLTEKIFNQSAIKFQKGVIPSSELAQNQNQYLKSLSDYYQSVFELLAAQNKLNKLLNTYENK